MLEVSHPWRPAPPRWHPRGERGEHTRRVCVAPMNPRGGVSPPEAVMLKIASLLSQFIVYLSSAHFSFILVSGQFSSVRAFIPTGYEPGLALGFWKVTRNHHCRQYVERGKL